MARLKVGYRELALEGPEGLTTWGPGLAREIQSQEERLEHLKGQLKTLPSHVPVGQAQDPATVVELEQERKRSWTRSRWWPIGPRPNWPIWWDPSSAPHHKDEARSFLRQVFQLPADLVPDLEAATLTVRLHSMAHWRSNRALAERCDISIRTRLTSRLVLKPLPAE